MITINWSSVVTNVVSAICVMVVSGACIIMWREATTVQEKIDKAKIEADHQNDDIRDQTKYMKEAVELLQQEMIGIKTQNNEMIEVLNRFHPKKHSESAGSAENFEPLIPVKIPNRNYIQEKLPELRMRQQSR